MTDCPDENTLQSFLDGRLDPAGIPALQQHVDACAACFGVVRLLASAAPAASAGPAHAPTDPGPAAPGTAFTPGERVACRYRVVRFLARGGMGQVYHARDEVLDIDVALKALLAPISADAEALARFKREVLLARQISHDNVCRIYDLGLHERPGGTVHFFTMELLAGATLGQHLHEHGPLAPGQVLPLARQMAQALHAAHQRGIVHRDFKPDNVFLVPAGPGGARVVVADFGLARTWSAPEGGLSSLTEKGMMVGTPAYMAPEQLVGQAAGPPADVYALGLVIFEMLTGQRPFSGDAALDTALRRLQEPPPSPRRLRPELDPRWEALVLRCLERDPAARYPSAQALDQALAALSGPGGAVSGPRPALPPARTQVLAGAALVLALGLGGLLAVRGRGGLGSAAEAGMVRLPGGTFTMGSSPTEVDAAHFFCLDRKGAEAVGCARSIFERETPQREVTVKPFRLDLTEVTNEHFVSWLNQLPRASEPAHDDGDPTMRCSDYPSIEKHRGLRLHNRRCVEYEGVLLADIYPTYNSAYGITYQAGAFTVLPGLGRRPATQMTWEAARRYCEAQGKRLPTEAEWEFAARGAGGARFPWGSDEPRCEGVVFARLPGQACEQGMTGPADVGTSPQDRTPQGVLDLGGNVSEWVQDWFHERYPPCAASPCVDPIAAEGADSAGQRVVRGGNWEWSASSCRAASRSRFRQDSPKQNVGFRCASSLSAGR